MPLIVSKRVDTRSLLLALLQNWNQMNLRAQIYDNDLRLFHFSLFPHFKIHSKLWGNSSKHEVDKDPSCFKID